MELSKVEIENEIIAIETALKYHVDAKKLNETGIRINEFVLDIFKKSLLKLNL